MTWNFNMDEAPFATVIWTAFKNGTVSLSYQGNDGFDKKEDLVAWATIKKPEHPFASDAKSVQSNPKVQPGNS